MRSAMPACFGAVAGKVWPAVRAVGHAAVATSRFLRALLSGRGLGAVVVTCAR